MGRRIGGVRSIKNSKDIKILIDMDDTIEDLLGSWVASINTRYGTSVSPEEIVDWEIEKFFPSLTRFQVFEPIFTEDFWDTVKPKKDAVKYVKMLRDEGYQVYICTNTNYKTLKSKMDKALFRYFDYLTWNDVIVAKNKQMIDADFLVDDAVHNLIGGKYKGILMDAPHNRDFNEKKHDIIRAKTWEEIYNIIKEESKRVK